jgi:hypothetical protein
MDGEIVRLWLRLAADALRDARSAIDVLNVFPVPDADTGTNLYVTLACAAEAVAGLPPLASPDEIWRAAAGAALLGACGNSGIIVSQMLRGLADTCGPASPCDGRVLAVALANAAMLARAAVQRPVEGTVLTVADAAARAAGRVTSLAEVTTQAAVGARLALAATQRQLAVLTTCGVVDAGAAGLCVVLDALSAVISGTAPGGYAVPVPPGRARPGPGAPAVPPPVAGSLAAARPNAAAPPAGDSYEVTFLLEAAATSAGELRDRLDQLGDSLVVSGGEPRWHVHVHAADAGAVIEAGLRAGVLSRITVTHLPAPVAAVQEPADAGHLVLTTAEGHGLARLLRAAGAVVADDRDGPRDGLVSLSEAARRPGRKIIISYAGTPWPIAAEIADPAAAGRPESDVQVIGISSGVQALAALAVHDPRRELSEDAASMRRAVAGMRHASVHREASSADPMFAGQVIGLTVARGADPVTVTLAVIDRLLGPGAELVTVLSGLAADQALIDLAVAHVRRIAPAADVACYDGGMASAVVLIGAE